MLDVDENYGSASSFACDDSCVAPENSERPVGRECIRTTPVLTSTPSEIAQMHTGATRSGALGTMAPEQSQAHWQMGSRS